MIFDLSKSFSKLCLAIYGKKIDIFLHRNLKMVQERKKQKQLSRTECFSNFALCGKK